jgi:hypothetical protein
VTLSSIQSSTSSCEINIQTKIPIATHQELRVHFPVKFSVSNSRATTINEALFIAHNLTTPIMSEDMDKNEVVKRDVKGYTESIASVQISPSRDFRFFWRLLRRRLSHEPTGLCKACRSIFSSGPSQFAYSGRRSKRHRSTNCADNDVPCYICQKVQTTAGRASYPPIQSLRYEFLKWRDVGVFDIFFYDRFDELQLPRLIKKMAAVEQIGRSMIFALR